MEKINALRKRKERRASGKSYSKAIKSPFELVIPSKQRRRDLIELPLFPFIISLLCGSLLQLI